VDDRWIMGILEKFPHKLPTKSLVKVYLSTQLSVLLNCKVIFNL